MPDEKAEHGQHPSTHCPTNYGTSKYCKDSCSDWTGSGWLWWQQVFRLTWGLHSANHASYKTHHYNKRMSENGLICKGLKFPRLMLEWICWFAPKLFEPWEIINSRSSGPYAARTLLGWVVNGTLRGSGSDTGKIGCPTVNCESPLMKWNSCWSHNTIKTLMKGQVRTL